MAERPHVTRRHAIATAAGAALLVAAPTSAAAAPAPGRGRPRREWRDVPIPAGGVPYLTSVAAPTRRSAIAVGQYYQQGTAVTNVLHLDGGTWRFEPVSRAVGWAPNLEVAAATPNAAWIVGMGSYAWDAGSLYWDGATWTYAAFPYERMPPYNPYVAAEPGPGGTGWAITTGGTVFPENNMLLRFENGAWVPKQVPFPTKTVPAAVEVRSPRDVWVGGTDYTAGGQEGTGYTLHWNGRKWRRYDLPDSLGTRVMRILALSRRNVWAYTSMERTPQFLWHFDGSEWTNVTQVPRTGESAYPYSGGIASDGRGIVLAGMPDANLGRSNYLRWDGSSWTTTLGPPREAGDWISVNDVARVPGTRTLLAVGANPAKKTPFVERRS
ncbi:MULTISPECIES: hypothetical protein [Actinomadura]|uniref:Secreted protein n=2 Tax=Actinomadura yumaensis TaxID=111807 RepID=A0ABW2CXL8_9ACTN|nr:hypothetical protein [Actinomadura sp. J1-007]MWK34210.1 hypothetical protein [Actinomadura sp. J1-007]